MKVYPPEKYALNYCPQCGGYHPTPCPTEEEIRERCAIAREDWTPLDFASRKQGYKVKEVETLVVTVGTARVTRKVPGASS